MLVKVCCTLIYPRMWNLAIACAKSTRELNDFIDGKYRRKSCKRLLGKRQNVSFRTLIACNQFVRRMVATLPAGHFIQSRPDWEAVEVLSKWMRRLGFEPYTMNGVLIYYLEVPTDQAVGHPETCSISEAC